MKMSGCRMVFNDTINEYNMVIEVSNPSSARALEGLGLVEDELPAEISFHVPEMYHKRIIGVGGKNIQRIMKKFGVYVKFSNAEEFASLGGYFENMDNVIARTPAKNAASLGQLKEAILELLNPNEQEVVHSMIIPRHLHRHMMRYAKELSQDIDNGIPTSVDFPARELGTDDVLLRGPEQKIISLRQQLQVLFPEMHEITVPASQTAAFVIRSPEFFDKVLIRLEKEFGIELNIFVPQVEDSPGQECALIFFTKRGDVNVDKYKRVILDFLIYKQVPLHSQPSVQRTGSYANLTPQKSYDSFQHFNSKLLSPVTT
ncbi:hypothetical protein HDU76_011168, partial [Blyttiomyces sp. JEL0837]